MTDRHISSQEAKAVYDRPMDVRFQILRGHPDEFWHPDDLQWAREQAQKLLDYDGQITTAERTRIKAVWFEGHYIPVTPTPLRKPKDAA